MLHRQVSKQHLVHQAEDRRVAADPEGEREQRHGRENRVPGEVPERVEEILEQIAHEIRVRQASGQSKCLCYPPQWRATLFICGKAVSRKKTNGSLVC